MKNIQTATKSFGKQNKKLIGSTGEYFVCAELCKRNILAILTPQNNPLFDIIAVAPDASRKVTIQVKTTSLENNEGWKFGKNICEFQNNDSHYVVLVNLKEKKVDYYIYQYNDLSKKVAQYYKEYLSKPVSKGKNKGLAKTDVDFRWFDFKNFKEDLEQHQDWNILGF